ncbi:hypothetical protein KI387_022772, partial [Taxus chinensis]
MDEEMESLEHNQTWDLVRFLIRKRALQNKWVYRLKEEEGGKNRYKARLVVKGFAQEKCIDSDEIFSLVVKINSIIIVLSLVVVENLHLEQLDVKTAFLHGDLDEEIYMEQPRGYEVRGKEKLVCRLKKSLYGLKQARRQWYLRFDRFMIEPVLKYTEDELKRMQDAVRVRQASEPLDLIRRVQEIKEEAYRENVKAKRSQYAKEKLAKEVLQRLKELKASNNSNEQQALEEWRKKKLEEAKKHEATKYGANSTMQSEDTEMVAKVLESDWGPVLEEAGLSLPSEASEDNSGKLLQDGPETEDGIIPGRTLPTECHAEAHTDYDGIAVRWGLTHHKESAADCCQACLDQAKKAKVGEKKCNVWVYCPSESGCYSPDIYEHKHQECWLKQAVNPKTNFKGRYSEAYRREHPSAPLVVPWVSGITA